MIKGMKSNLRYAENTVHYDDSKLKLIGWSGRHEGVWKTEELAMETEYKLMDQPRGIEWEYRVKAVNKAGAGVATNTVMAVL